MDKLSVYVPFEKKDEDKRIVGGFASTEALDSQGEVVRLDAIEKALPEYMKYGNIREMHQWSAVGKTIQANIDKTKKGLYIVAKVIDGNAWEKCKEGVYNGFSIGGKIISKVGETIEELVLNEISLVDRPANPEAVFSLVKLSDGVEKSMPIAPSGMEPGEMENENVLVSDKLSQMASSMVFLIDMQKAKGRNVKHLERALKFLKEGIVRELTIDKLEKMEEEEAEQKSVEDQVVELKEFVQDSINKDNIQEQDWAGPYFEQLKEVL